MDEYIANLCSADFLVFEEDAAIAEAIKNHVFSALEELFDPLEPDETLAVSVEFCNPHYSDRTLNIFVTLELPLSSEKLAGKENQSTLFIRGSVGCAAGLSNYLKMCSRVENLNKVNEKGLDKAGPLFLESWKQFTGRSWS